jgi:hypothetical protein
VVGDEEDQQASTSAGNGNGAPAVLQSTSALFVDHQRTVFAPEEYVLEPGELSTVVRDGEQEIFRCSGCSRPECQVGQRASTGL